MVEHQHHHHHQHQPQIQVQTDANLPAERKKKDLTVRLFLKLYKLLFTRWRHNRKPSPKVETSKPEATSKFEAPRVSKARKSVAEETEEEEEEETMNGVHSLRYSTDHPSPLSPRKGFFKNRSMDNSFTASSAPFPLSRNGSRSPSPMTSRRNSPLGSHKSSPDLVGLSTTLSRNASRRSTNTPIMFSNSSGMLKPPAVEQQLECTLEELCFGCMKKIKITRDVVTNTGQMIQEEDLLSIKVKPGWKKGTKITFEGMGNERPGSYPADVIFVITEKRHRLFRRDEDDLELVLEIPLVKALTGCTIPIPLLGNNKKMSLTIDDIIYPGYEKIIPGQGMPNPKEQGKRGNLRVIFLVHFPTELTDEQRSDAVSILEEEEDSC